MKISKLVSAMPALQVLINQNLPARVGYRIARALPALDIELRAYAKQQTQIAARFGTPIEGQPNNYSIPEENKVAFQKELDELGETETISPLPLISFDQFGEISLSPLQINSLYGIIFEDEQSADVRQLSLVPAVS
jgi:hypothetical protein